MTINSHDTSTTTHGPRLWTGISDELRERRRDRAARAALRRELAAYDTPAEVDDLLGALSNRDDAAAEQIRTILTGNLARRDHTSHQSSHLAS